MPMAAPLRASAHMCHQLMAAHPRASARLCPRLMAAPPRASATLMLVPLTAAHSRASALLHLLHLSLSMAAPLRASTQHPLPMAAPCALDSHSLMAALPRASACALHLRLPRGAHSLRRWSTISVLWVTLARALARAPRAISRAALLRVSASLAPSWERELLRGAMRCAPHQSAPRIAAPLPSCLPLLASVSCLQSR